MSFHHFLRVAVVFICDNYFSLFWIFSFPPPSCVGMLLHNTSGVSPYGPQWCGDPQLHSFPCWFFPGLCWPGWTELQRLGSSRSAKSGKKSASKPEQKLLDIYTTLSATATKMTINDALLWQSYSWCASPHKFCAICEEASSSYGLFLTQSMGNLYFIPKKRVGKEVSSDFKSLHTLCSLLQPKESGQWEENLLEETFWQYECKSLINWKNRLIRESIWDLMTISRALIKLITCVQLTCCEVLGQSSVIFRSPLTVRQRWGRSCEWSIEQISSQAWINAGGTMK